MPSHYDSTGAWKIASTTFRQALVTYRPEPSVLSKLQTAIHEYRALKASGRRLRGQRSDDLTVVRTALGIGTVGQQTH
jgi:hypothetical protein